MTRPQLLSLLVVVSCGSMILVASAADTQKSNNPSATKKATAPASNIALDQGSATETGQVVEQVAETVSPAGEQASIEPDEETGPWEVTRQVELIYREKLEFKGEKTAVAKVQLKNTSELDLPGKLVLVIDGASQNGFALQEPNGQFTEETPYLQMLPAKRRLESGDVTPPKTMILTRDDSTSSIDPTTVELRWRAFALTKPAGLDDESDADEVQVPGKAYKWGDMRRVMAVQDRSTIDLVTKHNGAILGTGTAEDENGNLVILVYASQGGMSRKLPGNIEGVPVEVRVTGTIKGGPAYSRVVKQDGKSAIPLEPEPDSGVGPEAEQSFKATPKKVASPSALQVGPPTRRFTRPVPIGVSAINSTGVCASGTLGCRCIGRDGKTYVLSNNHVFAEENAASIGDTITQPSIGDNGCAVNAADVIATLSAFQKIEYFASATDIAKAKINIMDAAVGLAGAGMVDFNTPQGAYGAAARTPQEKIFPGMQLQKQGRTSNYTKGKIVALNVEVMVAYDPGLARFRSCINVHSQFRSPGFGAPGDSGSLVVTLDDRRPVGILFAGGGYDTFLNPISPVLHRFKVGVDDGTGAKPVLGSGRMGTASGPLKPKVKAIPYSTK